MPYFITIRRKILFGLIPWTTVQRAKDQFQAAKILEDQVGSKVHHSDIPRLVGKQFIIEGKKTITIFS